MSYLVIDIDAVDANMMQSPSILAPMPVMPAILFAHALDLKLGGDLGVRGVGLVHKTCSPGIEFLQNENGSLDNYLRYKRGAYLFGEDVANGGTGPVQNSVQPEVRCNYSWTLLLRCTASAYEELKKRATREMMTMRFAGGPIVRAYAHMTNDVETALTLLRRGFWIDDASNLLAGATNPIEQLLRLAAGEGDHGWLIPANLGYALLDQPTKRAGARDGFPHAFAEAMIGLVRLTPVRAAISKEKNISNRLWRHGWVVDQFVVTNRQDFQLSNQFSTQAKE